MRNIIAFCDASYSMKTKRAAACAIVMSDDTFHGIITKMYTDIATGARAELMGIIQTVEFLRTLDEVDNVTILCDSNSVVEMYNKLLQSQTITDTISYYDDWVRLLELSKGMNIEARYIPGHAECLSCNTICDITARTILRWESV